VYYDLHIHTTQTIGENTTEEMVEIAKLLDLKGIGVCRFFEDRTKWGISEDFGIDIIKVAVVKIQKPDELADAVKKARKAEIIAVHGGDYNINRVACENSMVDILFHPELGRNDSGFDHICARAAAENNVAVEINFREVLQSYRKRRSLILNQIMKNIMLCKKYQTPVIITSGAQNKWGMRSGRELASLAHILGMELGQAMAAVSTTPEEIIKNNRKKLQGKKIEGVEEVDE
jgi:ribonuclease P/MRP protein subunit RPP1